jgi:hypothetical protein
MKVHKCEGPEADADGWAEGGVNQCSAHGQRARGTRTHRSFQQKRRMDRAAGVQGTQRGGYISGRDSGR